MKFYKYQGAGNDFVLINGFLSENSLITENQVKILCDRHFGVGADGLMLLKPHSEYDFEMDYYNSDGSGGTMCGNGGRCIVAFAKKIGLIDNYTKFLASDGLHEAFIKEKDIVKLKMNDVSGINSIGDDYSCYTGSPHYVRFEDEIYNKDVYNEGRKIRYSEKYNDEGINVNFVKIENDKTISIRTYERGVENETFACGTGSVASAITFAEINNIISGEFTIKAIGGILKVSFEKKKEKYSNIWLTGLADFVFEGIINIENIKNLPSLTY